MQVPLPLAPVIDQTREIPSDVALQISAVYACVELLRTQLGRCHSLSTQTKVEVVYRLAAVAYGCSFMSVQMHG